MQSKYAIDLTNFVQLVPTISINTNVEQKLLQFTCKNTCTYENKSTNLQYKQFPVLREKLGLLHQTLLT